MLTRVFSLLQKANAYRSLLYWYLRIQASGLFDKTWYLQHNPGVAQAGVNPLLHYLLYGGAEGRDPGPGFSSGDYLNAYEDAKQSGLNPLVHYLKYGRKAGYASKPAPIQEPEAPYKCPVCQKRVVEFVSFADNSSQNLKNRGWLYKLEDNETINFEQYFCPHCGANESNRLAACYLREKLPSYDPTDRTFLLDTAPSLPLSRIFQEFKLTRQTADLHLEEADLKVDSTDMSEVASNSYDVLICSQVLMHIPDDRKALAELFRILKPGGWAILMVPTVMTRDQMDQDPTITDVAERWHPFSQSDHVQLYNQTGFVERVEAAGFVVRQLGVSYFGEAAFQQCGLSRQRVLYIVEKFEPNELVMTNDNALLTVLIITYNHKDSLAKAVDSVLEQETTYPYQIWLCDDCSTDGTLLICQSYANKYPDQIKLIAQPVNTYSNPNKVFHFETAVRSVNTKYFCYLDGDDYWCDKMKIQISLDILESKPGYVTLAHDTICNNLIDQTQKSLVHEMHQIELQNPIFFDNAPYLHASSRTYKNVVRFPQETRIPGDIYLYYAYLDKGPLFYYDKIMSVYNFTGTGMWSGLSPAVAEKLAVIDNYRLNKASNFRHDEFFTKRARNPRLLLSLKKIFNKKLSWELWFLLKTIEHRFSDVKFKFFRKLG